MPRGHIPPNPQLVAVPIPSPGSYGLNLQQQNQVLQPQWCIQASNAVIDYSGRIASRGGLTGVTSSIGSGTIRSIFEYRTAAGVSTTIIGADGSLSPNVASPGDNAIGGSVTVTNGRWFFQNFNNKCIGLQAGKKPIIYTGTGAFATVVESGGTAPSGGIGCAAFGRLWVLDTDGVTIKFCGLLDETLWTGGDSGSFSMAKVWPLGMDQVTAIRAFNGALAVYGTRQIVFYGSTNPTPLGLDVTSLTVVDMIEGTGCIGQWTIADVGETDQLFCSQIGIQSIGRLLVQRSRPTTQLSKYTRDALIGQLQTENSTNVTGFYSPTNGLYALSLPVSATTWVADQRHRKQDEDGDEVAPMTQWAIAPTAMAEMFNRTVYMSNVTGKVATYGSGNDYGVNFQFIMQIPWTDLGQQGTDIASRLKALKRLGALLYARSAVGVQFTWFTDFSTSSTGSTTATTPTVALSEYGIAQWAINSWSGGTLISLLNVNGSGLGQYYSFAITATVDSNFAVQQASLLAKILRIA